VQCLLYANTFGTQQLTNYEWGCRQHSRWVPFQIIQFLLLIIFCLSSDQSMCNCQRTASDLKGISHATQHKEHLRALENQHLEDFKALKVVKVRSCATLCLQHHDAILILVNGNNARPPPLFQTHKNGIHKLDGLSWTRSVLHRRCHVWPLPALPSPLHPT
jgi:hypothetical protein